MIRVLLMGRARKFPHRRFSKSSNKVEEKKLHEQRNDILKEFHNKNERLYLEQRGFYGAYSHYASELNKCKSAKDAFKVIEKMTFHQVHPSINIYSKLMDLCARTRDISGCCSIFDRVRESELSTDVVFYGAAIKTAQRCCNLSLACTFFEELLTEKLQPNVVIYCTMISACAQMETNSKRIPLKRQALAEKYWNDMIERNIVPNVLVYNAMFHLYAKVGQCEKALSLEKKMKQDDIEMNEATYTSLMRVLHQANQSEKAITYFVEAVKLGYRCNILFNMAMKIKGDMNDIEDVKHLWKTMDRLGIDKSSYTLGIYTCSLAKRGLVNEIWETIEASNIRPNKATWDGIHVNLYNRGDIDAAKEFLRGYDNEKLF